MSKFSLTGIFCIVVAFVVFVFQKVSFLMERKDMMQINTLNDIIGVAWLDKITWASVRGAAQYIGDSPITILLGIVGIVCIVVGGLRKNV